MKKFEDWTKKIPLGIIRGVSEAAAQGPLN